MTMTNIVINDGATTPVSHTFTPQEGQINASGFATWYEKLTGVSVQGWNWIKTRVTLASKRGADHVSVMQLGMPVVTTVDGSEVYHGALKGYITLLTPYELNSEDNQKAFWGLMKNAAAHAEATGVFVNQRPSQ